MLVGQDIVNYIEFPDKIFRKCHKMLIPKNSWLDQWERFVKRSLRDRQVCFADFMEWLRLPASLTPTPSTCCFFALPATTTQQFSQSLCFHPLCDCFYFFLALTNFATSDEAISDKPAPTRFSAGTTFSREKGIAVLRLTFTSATNPLRRWLRVTIWNETSICFEATMVKIFFR